MPIIFSNIYVSVCMCARPPAERCNKPKRGTLRSWFSTRTASSPSMVSRTGGAMIEAPPLNIWCALTSLWVAGVTSWVKNWKLNNWRLKSGGLVVNKDDFVKLDRLNAELEVVWVNIGLPLALNSLLHFLLWLSNTPSIFFFFLVLQMHIPGHAGYSGNEAADRLSREGAAKPLAQQHEDNDEYGKD